MRVGVVAITLVIAIAAADDGAAQAPSRADTLRWLAGCWRQAGARSVIDEQWMRPAGGTMLGMSRTVRRGGPRDSTAEFEHLRVFLRDGRLVFGASPSGQRYAEFTETELTDSSVSFGNPTHDFPQFVRYRRRGSDSLHGRVDGIVRGQPRAVDYRYVRVDC